MQAAFAVNPPVCFQVSLNEFFSELVLSQDLPCWHQVLCELSSVASVSILCLLVPLSVCSCTQMAQLSSSVCATWHMSKTLTGKEFLLPGVPDRESWWRCAITIGGGHQPLACWGLQQQPCRAPRGTSLYRSISGLGHAPGARLKTT